MFPGSKGVNHDFCSKGFFPPIPSCEKYPGNEQPRPCHPPKKMVFKPNFVRIQLVLWVNFFSQGTREVSSVSSLLSKKISVITQWRLFSDASAGWAPQIHRVHGVHCHRPVPWYPFLDMALSPRQVPPKIRVYLKNNAMIFLVHDTYDIHTLYNIFIYMYKQQPENNILKYNAIWKEYHRFTDNILVNSHRFTYNPVLYK